MSSYSFVGGLLAAAALTSSVVQAGTASAEIDRSAALVLTVQSDDGAIRTVRLECGPAGGTHLSSVAACEEIAQAGGDFDGLPGRPGEYCTMEYKPVVVSATGCWERKRVNWTHSYGNACQARVDTGSVFDL